MTFVLSVYIVMNALLNDMGYLEFSDSGTVDFCRTAVYRATRELTSPYIDLSVNLERNMGLGTAKLTDPDGVVRQVAEDLLRLRINGKKPLFRYVTPMRAEHARFIRAGLTYETMEMAPGRIIWVGGEAREVDRYLKVVPGSSGRHDPFGVFVLSGPGIRKGRTVAAGAVHTILNDILGHVRGRFQHPWLETMFYVLDRFGIVNPYTTNDVAPTLFYLADCPIPRYAVGSVMTQYLSRDLTRSRAVRYTEAYLYEQHKTSEEYSEDSDQEVIERLRGLGYID